MSFHSIHNSWTRQFPPDRLSMSQFRSRIRSYLAQIAAFEDASRSIASVLARSHGQLPLAYSDYITLTFTSLRESLAHFCGFLEDSSQLPLVLTALSYGFLSPLLFLEGQARVSAALVEELCLSYALHPDDTRMLSLRAKWASEALVERLVQLPATIAILLDQASFHEAHLIAIPQDQQMLLQ